MTMHVVRFESMKMMMAMDRNWGLAEVRLLWKHVRCVMCLVHLILCSWYGGSALWRKRSSL